MRTIIKKFMRIVYYLKRFLYTTMAKMECKSYGVRMRVNGYSVFTPNTIIGDYCNFNGMDISGGGKVTIGRYFHSGPGCKIICQNHNYEGEKIPYDDTYVCKDVTIGECVWLGTSVIILGGVHIGNGAIIQAGSVVVNDIPDYAIAGGHPAKVFNYRNREHYQELYQKGAFL